MVKVLSDNEVRETLEEIDVLMREKSNSFNLFHPTTYDHAPMKTNFPILGKSPLFSKILLRNRCHPNIRRVFKMLYGRTDLLSNHDRVSLYRPTIYREEWKSTYTYPNVHLDFNPSVWESDEVSTYRSTLTYNSSKQFIIENQLHSRDVGLLQGVLNLVDNREEDGGFIYVDRWDYEDWRRNALKRLINKDHLEGIDLSLLDLDNE